MRQARRVLCTVLAVVMLLTLFAGCGGGSGGQSNKPDQTVTGEGQYVNEYGWEISHVNEYGWEVTVKLLDIHVSNLVGYYAPDEDAKAGFENMKQYMKDKFNINLIVDCVTGDWPVCVQSNSEAELETNWKTLQSALTAAGIDQLTQIYQDNYKHNIGV